MTSKRKEGIACAKVCMSTIDKLGVGQYPQCKRLRSGDWGGAGIENLLPFYRRHKWKTH